MFSSKKCNQVIGRKGKGKKQSKNCSSVLWMKWLFCVDDLLSLSNEKSRLWHPLNRVGKNTGEHSLRHNMKMQMTSGKVSLTDKKQANRPIMASDGERSTRSCYCGVVCRVRGRVTHKMKAQMCQQSVVDFNYDDTHSCTLDVRSESMQSFPRRVKLVHALCYWC